MSKPPSENMGLGNTIAHLQTLKPKPKPEPSVLERLREPGSLVDALLEWKTHAAQKQESSHESAIDVIGWRELEKCLADAIAEIERLEEEAETSDMVLIDLQRKLNVVTEAETVWEARKIHGDGPFAFGGAWTKCASFDVEELKAQGHYEIRELIVRPEDDQTPDP